MKWNTWMSTVIPRTCMINGIEIDLTASDVYGSRIVILKIPGVLVPGFSSEYFVYTNGKIYRYYVGCAINKYVYDDITNTVQGKEAIEKIKSANLGEYLCEYRCRRRITHDYRFTIIPCGSLAIEDQKRPELLVLEDQIIFEVSHPDRSSIFCKSYTKINKKFIIELDGNCIVKHDDLHKKVEFNIVPNLLVMLSNEKLSLNEKCNMITTSILWNCFETTNIGECYVIIKRWVLRNIVYPHRREVLKRRITI